MEKIDTIWAIVLLPIIMFGPPIAHEIWTRRKEKAKTNKKRIEGN